MGYSVSQGVSHTDELLRRNLKCSLGISYSWEERGARFFLEINRNPRRPWTMTGSVMQEVAGSRKPDGSFMALRKGNFCVEEDGRISRGPKALRVAAGQ